MAAVGRLCNKFGEDSLVTELISSVHSFSHSAIIYSTGQHIYWGFMLSIRWRGRPQINCNAV